ncbi:hypothetical protein ACFOWB_02585 [Chenggangzhangella methanolivorans]
MKIKAAALALASPAMLPAVDASAQAGERQRYLRDRAPRLAVASGHSGERPGQADQPDGADHLPAERRLRFRRRSAAQWAAGRAPPSGTDFRIIASGATLIAIKASVQNTSI